MGESIVADPASKQDRFKKRLEELPLNDKQREELRVLHEASLHEQRQELDAKIEKLKDKNQRLIGSMSWRLTVPLRLVNGGVWYVRQKFRIFVHSIKKNPRLRLNRRGELRHAETTYYRHNDLFADINRGKEAKAAVVIHLYYTEVWPLLNDKISRLHGKLNFDLFITLPAANSDFTGTIKKDYPTANILEVPNRGRDVLPFMQVASRLEDLGYEYVLKLHSKKSPHRSDGSEWFGDIVNELVPEDGHTLSDLIKALDDQNCGVVGPGGQYISLLVNYDSNSFFLLRAIKRIYSREKSRHVHAKREDYGFFAGTMFWARLDALHKVFKADFKVSDFEHEARQIDGTLAHGLERIFCLVPELEGRDIYEINGGVQQIAYKSYQIPEWSDMHPRNRRKKKSEQNLLA